MKVLFMGTGPFAVPSLNAIHDSDHELVGLVTRPAPTNLRRKQKPPKNPMRDAAESLGLRVWDPRDVNSSEGVEILSSAAADLLVVCDYGQILSNEALATTPLGGINLHGSLLPKYRGAAPVHWAIYNGDLETGVTVIHMTPRLDGGPILERVTVKIESTETMPQLEARLSNLGRSCVLSAMLQLEDWYGTSLIGELQDASQVSKAPRLTKEQGQIQWEQSAEQIKNQVRAFQPWPGSYTWLLQEAQEPLRLVLGDTRVGDALGGSPGQVHVGEGHRLWVETGAGGLEILQLQPAGKRMMLAADFLRGYAPAADARMNSIQ
ncbi:MAG: methionyl-tRNA formyltransferase [Planctomycetota bacterium]|nr:methionyl-tRNA formyltransferase [Planctomycetota bacterium]